jgi:hypothetical protein
LAKEGNFPSFAKRFFREKVRARRRSLHAGAGRALPVGKFIDRKRLLLE